ncbi:MAG: hypothetical protein ACR2IK_05255 [Chloroflexota bacterium]
MCLTDLKRRTFDALVGTVRGQDCERAIAYHCPYPKYEFLHYLVADLGYLVHGSREADIQMFEPRPASDVYEFSAQRAVYAASDGIWAMVFAIRNRRPQQGTFFNGCSRVVHPNGTSSQPYYHFALAADGLRDDLWTNGTMYVLARETFVAHPLVLEHGLTVTLEEWASAEPIVPVAKIKVGPEDFPFLNDFWGYNPELLAGRHVWTDLDHDDRELLPIRPRMWGV